MGWGSFTYRPGDTVMVKDGKSYKELVVASSEAKFVPGRESEGPIAFYIDQNGIKFSEDDIIENLFEYLESQKNI